MIYTATTGRLRWLRTALAVAMRMRCDSGSNGFNRQRMTG